MLGPPLDGRFPAHRVASLIEGWWWRPVTGVGTVVPDGVVDLMWSPGSGPWLAGPDTGPRPTGLPVGARVLGLRLRPGVAPAVLGDDADRATDRSIPLSELWNRCEVDRLDQELGSAGSMGRAARRLGAAVARHVPESFAPDGLVVGAVRGLRDGRAVDIGGVGERQFRRRFVRAVGYGPAFYRRVARLDRFTDLRVRHPGRRLAELAAAAGYADESHLWRDCTALTGSTPARLGTGGTGGTG